MIKLLRFALFGIISVVAIGYPQEIPDGVKEYMYQLQNDPTVENGFDYAKMRGYIDQNTQFQDWYVGLPFRFFGLNAEKLETDTIDIKFEDLVEPLNRWCFQIRIKNRGYVYHALVKVDNTGFRPSGCGGAMLPRTWDEVRKKFPEESGIIPMYNEAFHLLYFPHKKNGKNIFHVRPPSWDDPMSKMTSKSLDNLDDGKTIVPLIKGRYKMYEGYRRRLKQRRKNTGQNSGEFNGATGGKK